MEIVHHPFSYYRISVLCLFIYLTTWPAGFQFAVRDEPSPCSKSTKSYALDHQGIPSKHS